MEAVEGNPMIEDHHGRYWWVCPCGDEGGPYDLWEQAWDAVVRHEEDANEGHTLSWGCQMPDL